MKLARKHGAWLAAIGIACGIVAALALMRASFKRASGRTSKVSAKAPRAWHLVEMQVAIDNPDVLILAPRMSLVSGKKT